MSLDDVIAATSALLVFWGIALIVKGIKLTLLSGAGETRFFGVARLLLAFLAVFGVFTALGLPVGTVRLYTASETPSAYLGEVGVKGYQPTPLEVTIPDIVLERGTVITVTTSSDVIDGDSSSVQALLAHPGPTGVSLREALQVTNNDRGVYTIRFAEHLIGSTINVVGHKLPGLDAGNVIINGDITGDGSPDVTIDGEFEGGVLRQAFRISSSGNTLHALTIQNFHSGVRFVSSHHRDGVGCQ